MLFLLFFEKSFVFLKKGCIFAPNMLPPLPVRTARTEGAFYLLFYHAKTII